MNWLRTIKSSTEVAAYVANENCDMCEHVEADTSLAVAVFTEADSFGESCYAVCQECLAADEQEEAEEEASCHQCHSTMKMGQLSTWKCYDFYPPQGDEPMLLCQTCRNSDTHKQRVRADQKACDEESEYLRDGNSNRYNGYHRSW